MSLAERTAEVIWREDDASRALGMKLEEVGPGRAKLSMKVQKTMANGQKVCHGGFIFALADSAFGFACNTHNQRCVSAGCSIEYLAPVFVDDRLTAEASEIERRGRRGIYDVTVVNQNGVTVALFRGRSATVRGTWV